MISPRPPVLPPARSWEVMAALREALGLAGMQRIFSVGHNQIGRYCRNPDISDDAERNPLDRVRLLLARGVEAGAEEAVRMAVGYLLEPLGMKAVPVGEAPPRPGDVRGRMPGRLPYVATAARSGANTGRQAPGAPAHGCGPHGRPHARMRTDVRQVPHGVGAVTWGHGEPGRAGVEASALLINCADSFERCAETCGVGGRLKQMCRLHDAVVVVERHQDYWSRLVARDDGWLMGVGHVVHNGRKPLAGLGIGDGL